ncbi:riboflavin kinase/FMN adenylyltransferase [Ochrobactrum sp. BH3]|nr:riboflavin kinase/FMN adenylyltransferase [Ochrobactrum sp. BH3]
MFIERGFALQPITKPIQVVRDGILTGTDLARGVIALGNFDGFHLGHQFLIRRAQQIAGKAYPVAIMSVEPHPRQFFNPDTVIERLALPEQKHRVAEMLGLDYIFEPTFDREFAALTPQAFVIDILHKKLDVSHIVVGENFRFGAGRKGDCAALVELAQSVGICVDIVPLQSEYSSTRVREALVAGDVSVAHQCLGRAWAAEIVWRDGSFRLAEGLVRPKEGQYVLGQVPYGHNFIVHLAGDGRIMSSVICPKKVYFLEYLPG